MLTEGRELVGARRGSEGGQWGGRMKEIKNIMTYMHDEAMMKPTELYAKFKF